MAVHPLHPLTNSSRSRDVGESITGHDQWHYRGIIVDTPRERICQSRAFMAPFERLRAVPAKMLVSIMQGKVHDIDSVVASL